MDVRKVITAVAGSRWLRIFAAGCVVALAVLSLVPRNWHGINSAAAHGRIQHFVAYFGTAAVIGLGTRSRRNPAIVIVALTVYAGLMELLQYFSSGREPAVEGFVWSSLGATLGALLAFAIRKG